MDDKTVSVIIPARNEQAYLKKTIEQYRSQSMPVEIVVVVNNSTDKTYDIAKALADKVLNFPEKIGVSRARNEGAKVATGDIFIFSDADSFLSAGAISSIATSMDDHTIGTPLGKQDYPTIKGWLFFLFKNTIHRLGIYHGVVGVVCCHRDLFFKIGGFETAKKIAEFEGFIARARRLGATYKLFTNFYTIASMRRYEDHGYINTILFWLQYKLYALFKKEGDLAETYFDKK